MTKHFIKPLAISAALAFSLASSAQADVTALQVWESWKSYAESFGQNVQVGSQETNGESLILRDVVISMAVPEANIRGSLDFLEFRERGDGTVEITSAPDYPFTVTADPGDGDPVDLAMIIRQPGMHIIASGEENDMAFEYLAEQVSVEIDKFIVDGKDMKADIRFELNGIDGNFALASDGSTQYSSELNAATIAYNVAFTDPEKGGSIDVKGSLDGFHTSSASRIPADFDLEDPNALFASDFATQGSFSVDSSESSVNFEDGSDNFSLVSNSGGSEMSVAIDAGSVEYGGSAKNIHYTVKSADIPFPEISFGFGEVAFNMLMSLTQSDEPRDYNFSLKLGDLEISDMIWGMFDPAAVMPRDPATIALDLSGQMKWLVDITDPEQVASFGDETPAELYSLELSGLEISAAGAAVTGGGGFTFDNSDLLTFDGLPAPTGEINLRIVGANGLLDRLSQMGLMPDEQAMGMRMMLGLFARPADGEDTLTSQIEVSGDGSVFANGQQLK